MREAHGFVQVFDNNIGQICHLHHLHSAFQTIWRRGHPRWRRKDLLAKLYFALVYPFFFEVLTLVPVTVCFAHRHTRPSQPEGLHRHQGDTIVVGPFPSLADPISVQTGCPYKQSSLFSCYLSTVHFVPAPFCCQVCRGLVPRLLLGFIFPSNLFLPQGRGLVLVSVVSRITVSLISYVSFTCNPLQ